MTTSGFVECFGDLRLDKRGNKLLQDLFMKGVHSIRQLSENSASQKGWYRFLNNERTTETLITNSMSSRCSQAVKGKIVLSIQDSSEINLYNHKQRIKKNDSIGTTNASSGGLGFFIHPSFVVDAATCYPYGFSGVKVWNRPAEKQTKHQRRYSTLPIEEKESYKWIESSDEAKSCLKDAETVIIVQDREGDIYEQFATVPDEKTHLLIRSRLNRSLVGGEKMWDKLSSAEVSGIYQINIPGDKRKKQLKRTAEIEVRYCQAEIKKTSCSSVNIAPSVKLYAVEARERGKQGESSICWRLLTSVPVTTQQEALLIIEWYSWRWTIEEVFRILKQEGFNIEASELEAGYSIRKLCLLMLDTIIKLFQMRIAYEMPEDEGLPADVCFNKHEQQCLEEQSIRLEGKTLKQKNPYIPNTLQAATWVIARLGGWKGYASERPPGITTLWIGLRRFYDIFYGYSMQNVSTR